MTLLARHHRLIRFVSLTVAAVSLSYMAHRSNLRVDITEEGLSELTSSTRDLIGSIDAERPVVVHAYISAEVPREFVSVRSRLLNVLREMEASGNDALTVRLIEPTLHSEEAQDAIDQYGIEPVSLMNREDGRMGQMDIFMGLVFQSGPHEEVIPFLDRGLSVEYELVRALRVVTQEKKKVVGVARTDATIMGNFDLQNRKQQPAWRVIGELRKQYEVRSLNPGAAVPEDVDVLFVPQLSSMTEEELGHVKNYIDAGRPALLTVDPMPLFDVRLAPSEPKLPEPGQQQNPMFGQMPPQGKPKGDYVGLLSHVGIKWDPNRVVFDKFNPNPTFRQAPPHLVFVSDRDDGTQPFTGGDPVVDGLAEVVALFPGELDPASGYESSFIPLLKTGKSGGFHPFDEMVQRHPLFGLAGPMPARTPGISDGTSRVIGARVAGEGGSGEDVKPRDVVVLADLDLFGDQFFAMHERGGDLDGDGIDDVRFDNVTFLLNIIDSLAGDDGLVELRKRRPRYRRLSRVDEITKDARDRREEEVRKANEEANEELNKAKQALEARVKEINEREDLDETTKAVMLKSAEEAENRRLNANTETIEREKARKIARSQTELLRAVDREQNAIRLVAVLAPPIPALLLGFYIFGRKRRRENDAIPADRKRGAK